MSLTATMTTRSKEHRFSRLREQRRFSRTNSAEDKRKRLRLIPEWLEKNAEFMVQSKPPNSVNDPEAFQELINSISEGNSMAVKLLAEAGVNLNMKDSDGWTPLHHAVANGYDEVIEMLIEKGADSKVKNREGLTPFEEVKISKITRDRSRPVSRHKTNFHSSVMSFNTRSSLFTSFDVSLP